MSAVRHTPGPWFVEMDGRGLVILGPRKGCRHGAHEGPCWEMARIDNVAFPKHADEDMANARLIAAAPDLLETCELIEARDRACSESYQPVLDAASRSVLRAALAKARGGK